MTKRYSAAVLIAAAPLALIGTGGLAYANTTASSGTAEQHVMDFAAPPQADVRPFEHAKLSLLQAVNDAQKEMRGQTFGARFEMWHGQPSYLIRTFASNKLWQERVDANTGNAIGEVTSISQDEFSPQLNKDVAALQNVQTDFARAVNQTEQKEGGKAIMAAVRARPDGSVDYRLELVKNDHLQIAMIDAQSGQLR